MEHYIRVFLLGIFVMFGMLRVANATTFELPVMSDVTVEVTQGNFGSYSHYSGSGEEYAWDWTFSSGNICRHPVTAPVAGTVVSTHTSCQEYDSCGRISSNDCGHGFGNHVIIEYDGGYRMIGHMHTVYVVSGEYVHEGQVIGLIGSTGYSTEAHIHDQSQVNSTIGGQSYGTNYHTTESSSEAPTIGQEITSTNSAVFDNRDTTALTDTNPYSHSTNWLGNTEGDIHWWDGQNYDETNAPDSLSNGYANTLYIQDFDGAYCDSTVSYGSGVNDGAIVYDALGGGRSAYIVQCEQWQEWISTDAPYVGPESFLGNPVTNVFLRGRTFYQLFQGGYVLTNKQGTFTRYYAYGFAPGEMADGSWNPEISYRFAEEYEQHGAGVRAAWQLPRSGVTSLGNGVYAQRFRKKALKLDTTTQTFTVISATSFESLVAGTISPSAVTTSSDAAETSDDDLDGFTPDDGDCDDTSFYTNPDHVEWLDGIDNDCDDVVDNDIPSLTGSTYSSQDVSSLVPVAYIDSYSDVQTYTNPFTGLVHGVFGGDDGDVYEITLTDGTWSVIDLSAHIWVPYILTGTQPFGFANEVSGMRYVVFTAETGDIWMFRVSPDNDIDVVDLSAHIWVPYATSESDPMGYADPTTGDIHVVFTGDDYYPWHIRLDGTTGGYSSSVLSAGVGIYYGTNAYPFMDPLIGDHYVLYTGSNGRVYLMVSGDGISYGAFDVSAQAAVAYSNSTPTGLVDPITEEFYVYLLGDNERLYEVHYNLSTWASRDLSALTPVPYMEPGTTPIATVNPFTGEHLISVLGDNRRVTLFTTTDTTVNSVDLTGQASVTYTETGTAPWVMIDPQTGVTHVLFTGDNFRVQYLRYGP